MRHTTLATTTLAAVLLAGSAMAQSRTEPTSPAPLGAQQQTAKRLDAGAMPRDTAGLLRQADQAVTRKNWADANEYVERAKTSWLNRESLAGSAAQTTDTAFGPAETAIRARDGAGAHRALQSAMTIVGQDDGRSRTGTGASPAPASGGGGPAGGYR